MRYSRLVYIHGRSRQWACQINPTAVFSYHISYLLTMYPSKIPCTYLPHTSPFFLLVATFFSFTSYHLFCHKHCSRLEAFRKLLAFVKRFALILGVISELILLLFIGMLEFCYFFLFRWNQTIVSCVFSEIASDLLLQLPNQGTFSIIFGTFFLVEHSVEVAFHFNISSAKEICWIYWQMEE